MGGGHVPVVRSYSGCTEAFMPWHVASTRICMAHIEGVLLLDPFFTRCDFDSGGTMTSARPWWIVWSPSCLPCTASVPRDDLAIDIDGLQLWWWYNVRVWWRLC